MWVGQGYKGGTQGQSLRGTQEEAGTPGGRLQLLSILWYRPGARGTGQWLLPSPTGHCSGSQLSLQPNLEAGSISKALDQLSQPIPPLSARASVCPGHGSPCLFLPREAGTASATAPPVPLCLLCVAHGSLNPLITD